MAGEIATAYVAIAPSARGFGTQLASQIGPQASQVGSRAGQQAGVAFTAAASKESAGWFSSTAKMAVKNVALYGSMYVALQGVRQGIDAMFESMVGFNAELEQANIGFTTLLGSSSAANDQMQWIKDFAKETPFQYQDLVGYSQQLLALGFSAEMARDVLQATGDAAAALGRGSESIARINLALGQMWTKGKVQSQEMLQLTEAGIGAWQILADAYGTSVAEVQDAVTAGMVKATDAVPALIEGMNARFGGLMEKQSQTYAGVISNIQDTLQQQLAEAGEPLFQVLQEQASRFLDALDDPEVLDMMRDMGNLLADGARALAEAARLAWEFRDALLAVGIGIAAAKLLTKVPVGSALSAATWYEAATAQRAYASGLTRTTSMLAGVTERSVGLLRSVGQVGGLIAVTDGLVRVANAGEDAAQSAIGFAEAIGGGAAAGAAFGSVIPGVGTAIGAASGAVAGLAGSFWSMQAAMQAANADTSVAEEALRSLGVEANIAALALSNVTNEQLLAAGGFDAVAGAMRSGSLAEYVTGLQDQSTALHEQIAALDEQRNALERVAEQTGTTSDLMSGIGDAGSAYQALADQMSDLEGKAYTLDQAIAALGWDNESLAAAQQQVVAAAYEAAYAADMQTGALGAGSEAAWNAVVSAGALSGAWIESQLRAEGLAGTAGYLTQMILGIPVGTAINFSTNAADVARQIAQLYDIARGGNFQGNFTVDGYERQMESLKKKAQALATAPKVSLASAPTYSGGGGGGRGGGGSSAANKAAQEAQRAAEEAARKLEQDRTAQVRFGDAFGSLMEAALGGNFEQYRDRLEDQITSLTRDGYKAAADTLRSLSTALSRSALDYSALTSKLEAATDAYDDLTKAMRDQYATSRDLILGLGQATDAQSFEQLAYLLGETTNRASEYQGVLEQLKSQGLSEDLWNQLAQAGPESMQLAQSILDQGAAGIEQLNSLSDGLVGAAESMGDLVSSSMYQQGKDAMNAYIDGLKSQSSALESQLATIANNVLNRTAGAITPGNAGYAGISAAPQQVVNEYNLSVSAESLGDLKSVQDFLRMLEQAPTTQLVNQAGTVVS